MLPHPLYASIAVQIARAATVTTPLVGSRGIGDWEHDGNHIQLHSSLETIGAVIAFVVAGCLLHLGREREGWHSRHQLAAAFTAMGVLDAFHACSEPGLAFVLYRVIATALGGALLASLWLPREWTAPYARLWTPCAFVVATTLGAGVESKAAQIMIQLEGVLIVAVLAPVATFIILTILKLVFGSLRVTDEEEFNGLDLSSHSESAYAYGTGAQSE